jgi:Protein of unknown function (DUF3631)
VKRQIEVPTPSKQQFADAKLALDARPDEDPDVPPTFRNRVADNWRVLLSIADSFGHGEAARAAAFALSADTLYEDPGVRLLTDIRTIFRVETAWASYCPQADTPTQSKIIPLLRS